MLNILDVPYYLEEIQESDATQSYHEYVRHMLSLAGLSAVMEESDSSSAVATPEPAYPMAPTIEQFLEEAGDRVPDMLHGAATASGVCRVSSCWPRSSSIVSS